MLPAPNGEAAPFAAASVQLVDVHQLSASDDDVFRFAAARTCANINCSSEWRAVGGQVRALFACAQCVATFYCSVECQVSVRARF
jgi:hypothetical protein